MRAAAVGLAPPLLPVTERAPRRRVRRTGRAGRGASVATSTVDDLRSETEPPALAAAARAAGVAAAWAMPILGTDGRARRRLRLAVDPGPPARRPARAGVAVRRPGGGGHRARPPHRRGQPAQPHPRDAARRARDARRTRARPRRPRDRAARAAAAASAPRPWPCSWRPRARTRRSCTSGRASTSRAPTTGSDRGRRPRCGPGRRPSSTDRRSWIAPGRSVRTRSAPRCRCRRVAASSSPGGRTRRPSPRTRSTCSTTPPGRSAWRSSGTRSIASNQETEALRRAHDHQRTFLSRVSHELRTPLTAIHGYASSLNQTDVTWDDDAQRRFLDLIVAESGRMGRLVADLLDSSAIDSGVLRLQNDWCDLALVIDAAIACLPDAGHGRPAGRTRRSGRCGATTTASSRSSSTCSRTPSRHGDGAAGVVVDVRGGDEQVADPGAATRVPASRPTSAEAVFQPAVRGSPLSVGQRPGSGDRPRHRRRPRRRDRRGAVRRRSHAAGDAADRARDHVARAHRVAPRRGRRTTVTDSTRVLLVEDDRNIVDLIRSNLAARGFSVVVSLDGGDAMRLVEEERPDIALLDLMLPKVDGFELCRQIRERVSIGVIVDLGARRRERQGARPQPRCRRLHDQAVRHRRAPRPHHRHVAPHPTRREPTAARRPGRPHFGDLVIDLDAQRVTRRRRAVRLTPTEFALLREFAMNPGKLAQPRHAAAPGVGPGLRHRDRVHAGVRPPAASQARGPGGSRR